VETHAGGRHRACLCRGDGDSTQKGGVTMHAIGLYLLGVPVFVIVILWLFGVV